MKIIRKPINRTLNIAHRGASSLAPENTLAAFKLALNLGADGVEFDVQLSRDKVPVVIHDERVERTTTGRGLVKDFSMAELKKLDAGKWFAPDFLGEEVPTLDEVLSSFKNICPLFIIELKNNINTYPGLEEAVIKIIANHNLNEQVIISSFNPDSLITCHQLEPSIRTGIIYIEQIEKPWHYTRSLSCYSAHPLFFYLQDPKILDGFKAHQVPLYPWTVNDPEQMDYLVSKGVEAIITDYPQELKHFLP